jgi:hypothetical protein
MVHEHLCATCYRGCGYYNHLHDMEGGSSSHQLGDFEQLIHDIYGYGEDTQFFLQDLDDKVQIMFDWCEQATHWLNFPPPVSPVSMCSNILIPVQHFNGNFTLSEHPIDPPRLQVEHAVVLGPSMDIPPSF